MEETDQSTESAKIETIESSDSIHPSGHTRREIVRKGAKLAFVAPVISTLFANQAWAQASGNLSCYPVGHACTTVPGDPEPCCPTLACNGAPGTCQ